MKYENEVQLLFPWFNDSLNLFIDEMTTREGELYAKLKELAENFRDELDNTIKENS